MSAAEPLPALPFVAVGDNAARIFSLTARQRAERIADNFGLAVARDVPAGGPVILADLAYAWDPIWLKSLATRPGEMLMIGDRAVLAHVPTGGDARSIAEAMRSGSPAPVAGMIALDSETASVSNHELRKRERPFVLPLDAADPGPVERAAYDASYKGVTDWLTLYVWRRAAFHLTKLAAEMGLTPNFVSAVGAALCLVAFACFNVGQYWPGMAAAFAFMVLDTVDGKLARCTGQSSFWGNIIDHGIDLIHPPFWYWAWMHGLGAVGQPLEPVYATMLLAAIVAGYIAGRLVEWRFVHRFKMHIHVWRPFDSQFRLITARRNPNMAILLAALAVGEPRAGIELVALWTLVSLIVHGVRLAQANGRADRGRKIISWLA